MFPETGGGVYCRVATIHLPLMPLLFYRKVLLIYCSVFPLILDIGPLVRGVAIITLYHRAGSADVAHFIRPGPESVAFLIQGPPQ